MKKKRRNDDFEKGVIGLFHGEKKFSAKCAGDVDQFCIYCCSVLEVCSTGSSVDGLDDDAPRSLATGKERDCVHP
jgi:hypothetical protein